ncbi:MAG TPA: hypothetical protein VL460_09910 [Caulobacteraceae bacterium]|jgi:hypothetical protein|nr:hypothetical protein [Caulobacteraceae bacterium]
MSRPLTAGEVALARSVFGDAIDYSRVRLSNRSWGWAAIVFGSRVTFPPSHPCPQDFADRPPPTQAWLVHELTHVWQFQTAPGRTLASWAATLAGGGYGRGLPGYRYALPLGNWHGYNLEQQASIVEHAFLLWRGAPCPAAPAGARLADYEGYGPFAQNV